MNKTVSAAKQAGIIGIISVLSYVANYFLRNMLGVLTPLMLKNAFYSKEYVALLSSVYMIAYAAGQLLNGVLGDIVKPKGMVLIGLVFAGAASALFPFLPYRVLQIACFLIFGYALSMVRGPLMKIISENTEPRFARVICVFFSFSSFAGPLIAGLLAMLFQWQQAFVVAGVMTVVIAAGAYTALTVLEKRDMIHFHSLRGAGVKEMFGVFKIEKFAFYLMIACLVEIAAASVSFWIPTFLTEYVCLNETKSYFVFSVISLMRALIPFAALAVFKLFGERDILIMRCAYMMSVAAFAVMLFIPAGMGTVVFLLIALLMNSLVSSLLWSIYIPSLGKTGRVSSVNGILDCAGYIAAGAATSVFAGVVVSIGWHGLIVAWCCIPALGLIATLLCGKKKQKSTVSLPSA